ncbi:helix-turn-helix domain-containing protein [Brachybacterium kimchii]|uniref:Helix-turn-helix transcriptional regulator n=1 Tax=Brachybacterium kimchii TaxID=2942909 RepID=A0ABY4N8L0_9MICO|nr:helix-turn-helix transcriptional regulator [Brachybacterium kimchii]UQN30900.1 helix-turn-helix transcriptional regulator [Brachybacterium kimchii]
MTSKDEARAFLVSRRAQITPAEAGVHDHGDERRVPGLRREEVAELAGVSVGYYKRLERGELGGASESVLDAVARALRLTNIEREHLLDLARQASTSPSRSEVHGTAEVRASLRRLVESMGVPAIVQTPRLDLVAANDLARALFSPVFEAQEPNFARFNYLDPRARDFYVDWPLARRTGAAILRREAGRDPRDKGLTEFIGELTTLSPLFREDWARLDVHEHRTGTKRFVHPDVGRLDLAFEVLETPGDSTHRLVTYSAEPGTEADEKLAILGSLAAERRP